MANKRFGDAGCDHGQIGIMHRRNGGKGVHDAPDRAEQADKWGGRPNRGQEDHIAFQPVHLPHDGHVHCAVDASRAPRCGFDLDAGNFYRAAPFAHRGAEYGGDRVGRVRTFAFVQVFQAAAGPELILKGIGFAVDPAQRRSLFSIMMAQTQTLASSRISMTSFTTTSASRNKIPKRQIGRRGGRQCRRIYRLIHIKSLSNS